jgi:ribonuclease HII
MNPGDFVSGFTAYHWRADEGLALSDYEVMARESGFRLIAGVDEAGRGPLAGPIVAAAVMLSGPIAGVNDSKQLTEKKRESLYAQILSGGHQVGVCVIEASEIDAMGLQPANYASMTRAAEALAPEPEILLVDGFRISGCRFEQRRIIKGDGLSQSIAAASIVAKVTRDRIMVELDGLYPAYGFARHKGYGTKVHMEAIEEYGPCAVHRRSFAPIARALETGSLL